MKKLILTLLFVLCVISFNCTDAGVASMNVSKAADNFEVMRRIVFYNGITGEYMLTIEGLLSINSDNTDKQLEVTCKTGPNAFKKHYLGLSDNVTYFMEQLDPINASIHHYRVIFKPSVILPNIEVK